MLQVEKEIIGVNILVPVSLNSKKVTALKLQYSKLLSITLISHLSSNFHQTSWDDAIEYSNVVTRSLQTKIDVYL